MCFRSSACPNIQSCRVPRPWPQSLPAGPDGFRGAPSLCCSSYYLLLFASVQSATKGTCENVASGCALRQRDAVFGLSNGSPPPSLPYIPALSFLLPLCMTERACSPLFIVRASSPHQLQLHQLPTEALPPSPPPQPQLPHSSPLSTLTALPCSALRFS